MAWTAPMTAVASTVFTAAQFNTYVRDNLNETAPAKATVAGQIFVSTAANSIAARTPAAAFITTSEGTANNAYGDLATVGPAVTATTGTHAFVAIFCRSSNTGGSSSPMAYDISGATTLASSDDRSIGISGVAASPCNVGAFFMETLTAGSNTFTAKYRAPAGTGTWQWRRIVVIPL